MKENSETSPTVTWETLKHGIKHVMEDIEPLDRAYAEAALVKQLSKVELDEEIGALGWRVLMNVFYEDAWQWNGWVWVKIGDRQVEHIALFSGLPNGHSSFIKFLSVEELKELIIAEAEGTRASERGGV